MRGQGRRRGTQRVFCTLLLAAAIAAAGAPLAHATVTIDDVSVNETDGAASATFTVTRAGGALAPALTISYATADGSARAPDDYTAAAGSVAFDFLLLGGMQTRQVTVAVAGDRLDEATESFRVVIAGAEVTKNEGTATIVDDDPSPGVSVLDAPPVTEGAVATFTVALSAPSGRDVVVGFSTADGSAVAPQDYTARGGSIGIPAGATSASLGVPTADDDSDEPDESFELRLSGPSGAGLGDASATATLLDNDALVAAAPASPGSSGDAPPASGSSTGSALPQLGVSSPRLRRPSTILVTISCPHQAGRCTGRISIFSRPSPRSKIKDLRSERRLGRRTFTLTGGSSRTLQMALSRRDLVLLRRAGRMNVRAYAVTQDGAGRTGVRRVFGTLIGRTTHSG